MALLWPASVLARYMRAKSRPSKTTQRASPNAHRALCGAVGVPTAGGGGWLASAGPPRGAFPLRRSLLAPAKQPHGARDGYADWDLAALAGDLS